MPDDEGCRCRGFLLLTALHDTTTRGFYRRRRMYQIQAFSWMNMFFYKPTYMAQWQALCKIGYVSCFPSGQAEGNELKPYPRQE